MPKPMWWQEFIDRDSLTANIWHGFKVFLVYCLMFAFLWKVLGSLHWAIVITAVLFLLTIFIAKLYDGFWDIDAE